MGVRDAEGVGSVRRAGDVAGPASLRAGHRVVTPRASGPAGVLVRAALPTRHAIARPPESGCGGWGAFGRWGLGVTTVLGGWALAASSRAWGAPPSTSYKLVFADEFNGTSLDTLKWNFNYTWGPQHNHQAYMTPSQVKFTGTAMNLQAIAQRNPNATDFWRDDFGWQVVNYQSGAVNSSGKFNATYGYFEARMRMPSSLGSWPAFWMLQGGWPPEVDIMEFVHTSEAATGNTRYRYYTNYHYTNNSGANASYFDTEWVSNDLTAGYNLWGFEWSPTALRYYYNGTLIRTVTDTAAIADSSNMYLILNHAVGGWAGTPPSNSAFPSDFLVDYVRVYQLPASTSTTTTWSSTTTSGSWDTASNWSVQVPRFQDVTATFRTHTSPSLTISWNNSRTVGGLLLDSTTTSYNLGDADAGLQFARSSGNATIDVPGTNSMPHTLTARLELWSNTTVTNQSAQTLTLAGVITGDGDLIFEGSGTTVVANNNTYLGDTYIDNGTQGPAVVRVTRSRPFGTTGTVRFNPAGNATSGRIEIQDNREIPNPIVLTGRTAPTVAFQNLSGTNTLSGTLSLDPGGAHYIVQSDTGELRLTGSQAAAGGVAVRASATTGTRTLTLQGAGDGWVSGNIINGSTTVAVAKSGGGTWRFSGTNTYGGTTTVNLGTLRMDGSHVGGGSYTVAAGAALTGVGLIDPATGATVTINGTVAPGQSQVWGTLTIGSTDSPNDVIFNGELAIELAGGSVSDRLAVVGRLDLSNPASRLRIVVGASSNALRGGSYTLATFTPGTLGGGRFGQIYLNDLLVGGGEATYVAMRYSVIYDDAAGAILLRQAMIPEPSGTLLMLGAASAFGLRRRGRS